MTRKRGREVWSIPFRWIRTEMDDARWLHMPEAAEDSEKRKEARTREEYEKVEKPKRLKNAVMRFAGLFSFSCET